MHTDSDSHSEEASEEEETPVKEVIAPVPDHELNFQEEIERALQSFLESEHQNDVLMPSINGHITCLKDRMYQSYVTQDKLFKRLYDTDNPLVKHI